MSRGSVLQDWVQGLPMMQQTVLLTAVRGPDGLPKYHATKWVLRWYRRCILLSAMDGRVLADPVEPNGGSFTGPSCTYKHPDDEVRTWWHQVYLRLVHDMHLWPETAEQLDDRLGDSRSGWLRRADPATLT